ncbi:MAG TPA: hypothetical protein VJT08_20770 [Terriglobales bacterium]|nr:hypothetical protein [Terriglobales bacterium]
MEPLLLRGKCPICGQGPLRPLAMDYRVQVTKRDTPRQVGGLLVYQCTKQGHVFFVMAKDAEEYAA